MGRAKKVKKGARTEDGFLYAGDDEWNTGSAELLLYHPDPMNDRMCFMAVRCRVEGIPTEQIAFLDTGAERVIIGGRFGQALFDELLEPGTPHDTTIGTRKGVFNAWEAYRKLTLVSDIGDDFVRDDVKVLLVPDESFPFGIVLGTTHFLDSMRLALDPGTAPGRNRLYFGPLVGDGSL